ncbi:MAG: hypothetical protein OEY93_01570 [Anaerolineae bacterium]|nr:hypothetical protein [Anaerolineae bacterium]
MSYETFFNSKAHQAEIQDLPLLRMLAARYKEERPFSGVRVVVGHLLVRNTMAVIEALISGGADLVIAEGHRTPAADIVIDELAQVGIAVLPNAEAVLQGDIFLDVNAVLGRLKTPQAAAEVTRTGILHYQHIACPVVSADDCKAKKIEGFYGTGDGFLRAWRQLKPEIPLEGKRLVQFGYGKIGRGAAFRTRAAGLEVIVADVGESAQNRARQDGFRVVGGQPNPELEQALAQADIVIAVTSIPDILSRSIPAAWLRANNPALVNLGAQDEFGPNFADGEIVGGKAIPLNFHLANPTENRYVDAPLAAHVLALEALLKGDYKSGVHPLPPEMDDWLLENWRAQWPQEDLTGIGEELGLV